MKIKPVVKNQMYLNLWLHVVKAKQQQVMSRFQKSCDSGLRRNESK